jgi:hypothetical protein
MNPSRITELRRQYHRARGEVEDVVANAMCETYREITGQIPSDKLREAIAEAVRWND